MARRRVERPTIATIAERAGVSKGAVSYALNGLPGVSDDTRARILSIANEVGWSPNSAARALSGARSDTIGLALSRPARTLGVEPFFMEFISGLEATLADRSIGLLLQVVPDTEAEIEVYGRWAAARRVDGVIVADLRADDPRIEALQNLGLAVVIVTSDPGMGGPFTVVWSDDDSATADVLRYLATLGHQRIARVAGIPDLVHTSVRTHAFARVCNELGLDPSMIVETDYSGEDGARATRTLLSRPDRPTAIIFDNDIMAVAGLSVANEMGIDVPQELSIVAWDDSVLCRLTHPPLTAMSRDVFAYGNRVASILLAVIDSGGRQVVQDTTPTLVPRGSSSPPKSSRTASKHRGRSTTDQHGSA